MEKLINPTVDQIIELWCNALESGKYAQTVSKLCKIDMDGNKSYCCLGVLTDLYQKHVGDLKEKCALTYNDVVGKYFITYADKKGCKSDNVLLDSVKEWAHLNDCGGNYGHGFTLWQDNDMRHKTFAEISNIIKANRATLFNNENT